MRELRTSDEPSDPRRSARHWSLPLALLATSVFVHFASEVREGELGPFDSAVFRAVATLHGPLDGTMLLLTRVGGTVGMSATALGAAIILLLRRRRREALFLLVSAGGTLLLNVLLKSIFHRVRPDTYQYLIPIPASYSFPSGHAMGSMGVLASLIVVLYASRAPRALCFIAACAAALFVLGVGVSRLYFGVHYPSDVIAGELAAAAWVSAMTIWFHPRPLRMREVQPDADRQRSSSC